MKLVLIGAGGLAREISWLISDINDHQSMDETAEALEVVGNLVSDLHTLTPRDSGVIGDFSWLESNSIDGLVLAIGNPNTRLRLSTELKERFPKLEWPALIHPSVKYHESVSFGEGTVVAANSILAPNAVINDLSFINFSCFVGHESIIGPGTVVNPLTSISGGVRIGRGVLVGAHSVILQYRSVGDHATVGAGSMVLQDVPPHVTVLGVPARQILKGQAAAV